MSHNRSFIRDGSSPRRAPEPSDAPRAPSLRDERADRRSRLRDLQADEEQLLLRPDIDPQVVDVRNQRSSDSHIMSPSDYKTNAKPRQDKPHSTDLEDHSSNEVDFSHIPNVSKVPCVSNQHPRRVSNSSDFEQSALPKINWPSPSNPIWKEANTHLLHVLPQHFNPEVLKRLSTSELADLFDVQVHSFFLNKFGEAPAPTTFARHSPPKRRHRGLEKLRKQKNFLKKERKQLEKAGLSNTSAYADLSSKWFRLVRRHNALRKAVTAHTHAKAYVAAGRSFKKDPNKFANKLFNGGSSSKGEPTFSAKACMDYFSSTYRDDDRGKSFVPLEGMERPSLPKVLFAEKCPSKREITRSTAKKRNKAAAGMNSLTYVVYKKCPVLIDVLYLIIRKIWDTQDVPDSWASAFIVLLSKSEDLDSPSEFRPIAITNTVGKIFFSIVSSRLQSFLVDNNYIDRAVQKGFLSGIAGCVEHSFALFEALRDATQQQRQIVITWIDLANAFGSVRHNLIQFALDWYHVPKMIQNLVFNYYEMLKAKVQTNNWSTGFFLFDIGVFQGCVLSTILFDCVFQLLLDMLAPLSKKHGYTFKTSLITKLNSAYADDLAVTAKSPKSNQVALDVSNAWLNWAGMIAKPKKCISLAFRQFDPRSDSGFYKPFTDTIYSPYDPLLTINGSPIRFMLDFPRDKPEEKKLLLSHDHFKFLGRWIPGTVGLSDAKIKEKARDRFASDMLLVEKSGVNGLMKLWLYQHFVLARSAWSFLINDFCLSFAVELAKACSLQLKRWAGLNRSADIGCLFRSRNNFGLGLTSVREYFVRMQFIKTSILSASADPAVRSIHDARSAHVRTFRTRWTPHNLAAELKADVELDLKFQSQPGRLGLGHGHFVNAADVSGKHRRQRAAVFLRQRDQNNHLVHAQDLARQGVWVKWHDRTLPFDLSWKNLIFGPGPDLIKFVLNATINTVRTPDALKLWGYVQNDSCHLCGGHQKCTLHHQISGCPKSLQQGRYTWRHNSVLANIKEDLIPHITSVNAKKTINGPSVPHISKSFVRSGNSSSHQKVISPFSHSLLNGARDWEVSFDLDSLLIFPPEIFPTGKRPDIVVLSRSLHIVILIELTVPAEEGIEAAHVRKLARYLTLITSINDDKSNPWTASTRTLEIGARGFVPLSASRLFKDLGYNKRSSSSVCKALSMVAAKCSYALHLAHAGKHWRKREYLLSHRSPSS